MFSVMIPFLSPLLMMTPSLVPLTLLLISLWIPSLTILQLKMDMDIHEKQALSAFRCFPKRGRGRPSKAKQPEPSGTAQGCASKPKRGRERPRQNVPTTGTPPKQPCKLPRPACKGTKWGNSGVSSDQPPSKTSRLNVHTKNDPPIHTSPFPPSLAQQLLTSAQHLLGGRSPDSILSSLSSQTSLQGIRESLHRMGTAVEAIAQAVNAFLLLPRYHLYVAPEEKVNSFHIYRTLLLALGSSQLGGSGGMLPRKKIEI